MFLVAPLDVPGAPFCPGVASGNLGNGFTANVTGNDFAAAVLLDTWADGNSNNGFDLTVASANGPSIAAILSSDVVLNLVNDMGVLPEPIVFDPLGYVSASGNGANGIVLNQNGNDGAYAILAGIRADNNVLGDGIQASLTSAAGDAYAILVDADAAGNGDDGIDLSLAADGYAISALLFSDVDDNVDDGLHLVQNSANADAFSLLANTEAWSNGGVGFWADVTAPNGDAAICATEVEANYHGGRGARFTLAAGDEAALLVGTNALPLFDMEFSGFLGASILDTFWDVIPQGSAEFNNNGGGDFSIASNMVALTGSAPIQAREIRINGVSYDVAWSTVTNWTAYVVLSSGTNTLSVQAYDADGNLLSGLADSIKVNYTGSNAVPQGNLVINEVMYNPSGETASEYVEIVNLSSNTFDLHNFRLDGVDMVFDESAVILPGEHFVVVEVKEEK